MNDAHPAATAAPASSPLDADRLGAVTARMLHAIGKPVTFTHPWTGEEATLTPEEATSSDGLMPLFLTAADMIWREATGHSIGLVLAPDHRSLLGMRALGCTALPASGVLLCVLDAIKQCEGPELINANAAIDLCSRINEQEDLGLGGPAIGIFRPDGPASPRP
jgi:hypothetical protein